MSSDNVMKEYAGAVRETFGKLDDRHYHWIVGFAIEGAYKALTKAQDEMVRIESFGPMAVNYTKFGKRPCGGDARVAERVAELQASILGYTKILDALQALHNMLSAMSATAWAEAMRDSGLFDTLLGKKGGRK